MRISDWSSDVCSSDLPEATYPTSWSRPVMDVSLAWLELDMRTVLGSRAIGARGCRRRGGTITVRSPPGVATRGMEWPDCARHPGAGPSQDPLALPATTAAVGAASAASSWLFSPMPKARGFPPSYRARRGDCFGSGRGLCGERVGTE